MNLILNMKLEEIYPTCYSVLGPHTWRLVLSDCTLQKGKDTFLDISLLKEKNHPIPEFLPDLESLEWALHKIRGDEVEIPQQVNEMTVNPTLHLLELTWKNLLSMIFTENGPSTVVPEPGEEVILIWREPETKEIKAQKASEEDLLVLKIVVERIGTEEVASAGNLPIGAVDSAIDRAIDKGLLLRPQSLIKRSSENLPVNHDINETFLMSSVFTLQWHITQACDLSCKHCYDRSNRSSMSLEKAFGVLDDLYRFCKNKNVKGQVSFSGGNPLLYPHFHKVYGAAFERGFAVAILGNPTSRERIEQLISIGEPAFYQISLEGLPEHNDHIRGSGHFKKSMEFLKILRDLRVYSIVMLTLTNDNMDQVLPLAEELHDLTDCFTFNRLSQVGEGADLEIPDRDEYSAFLKSYIDAAAHNSMIRLKDNLINILYHEKGYDLFGGCSGYGCGAAFNFISVLPDGEAHACRKFPSLIGNVFEESIKDIYDSEMAQQYRAGTRACLYCSIRHVCGSCLAVGYGQGLNIFEERDPHCFIKTG